MANKYHLVSKDNENAFNAEISWLAEEGYRPHDNLQVHLKEGNIYSHRSFTQTWILKDSIRIKRTDKFLIRVFVNRETGKWDFELDRNWIEGLQRHPNKSVVIEIVKDIFRKIIANL